MGRPLFFTGDPEADALLTENPLALLLGMLLDQQVAIEWAFSAPHRLAGRLDGPFTAATIAAIDPDELTVLFRRKPALHRYPASMAQRAHALCHHVVDRYDGDPAAIWTGVPDGAALRERLLALPGFGEEKTRIFVALLAKRFGVRPPGWEQAAGTFADERPRSVADIDSRAALEAVRAHKQELKAQGRDKQGQPA